MESSRVAQRDLKKVQRAAQRLERVRAELRTAVLAAYESGESVRDIAPYANMSPSRIHDWVREARKPET